MTRLVLCILILGGTVAFLSCSDSLDDNTGAGGKGGGGGSTTHTDGTGAPEGAGRSGTDGTGPAGGTGGCVTGCDGTGPAGGRGGTTGVAGRGGTGGTIGPCDGIGTGCGGRGGSFDGSGPVAGRAGTTGGGGRGGTSGCLGGVACDGTGPVGGRGGTTGAAGRGGTGGAGGTLGPCDGLGYFQQRGWCASTYAVQATKQIAGVCVFTGTCDFRQVWTTRNSSLGDSLVCAYNGAGYLDSARVCTDTPMPAWNCNGAASSPDCLSVGAVPDVQACALTTMCGSGFDGAGPVGGRGGG